MERSTATGNRPSADSAATATRRWIAFRPVARPSVSLVLVGTLASLIGFVWVSFWAAPLFAIVFVYASRTLAALLEDPGAPNRVGRIALTAVGLAVTGSLILLTIGAVALIVGILLNGPMVG